MSLDGRSSSRSRQRKIAAARASHAAEASVRYMPQYAPPPVAPLLLDPVPSDIVRCAAMVCSSLPVFVAATAGALYMYQQHASDSNCHAVSLADPWHCIEKRHSCVYQNIYSVVPLVSGSPCGVVPATQSRYFAIAAHDGVTHSVSVGSTAAHFLTSHILHRDRRIVACGLASIEPAPRASPLPVCVSVDEDGGMALMDVSSSTSVLVRWDTCSTQSESETSSSSSQSDWGSKCADSPPLVCEDSPLLRYVGRGSLTSASVAIAGPCCELCHCQNSMTSGAPFMYLSVVVSLVVSGHAEQADASSLVMVHLRLRCALRAVAPEAVCCEFRLVSSDALHQTPFRASDDVCTSGFCGAAVAARRLFDASAPASLPCFLLGTAQSRLCALASCSAKTVGDAAAVDALQVNFASGSVGEREVFVSVIPLACSSPRNTSLRIVALTSSGALLLLDVLPRGFVGEASCCAPDTCHGEASVGRVDSDDHDDLRNRRELERWLNDVDDTEVQDDVTPRNKVPVRLGDDDASPTVLRPITLSTQFRPRMQLESVLARYAAEMRPALLGVAGSCVFVFVSGEGRTEVISLAGRLDSTSAESQHVSASPSHQPAPHERSSVLEWTQLKAVGSPGSFLRLLTSAVHNVAVPRLPEGTSVTKAIASVFVGADHLTPSASGDVKTLSSLRNSVAPVAVCSSTKDVESISLDAPTRRGSSVSSSRSASAKRIVVVDADRASSSTTRRGRSAPRNATLDAPPEQRGQLPQSGSSLLDSAGRRVVDTTENEALQVFRNWESLRSQAERLACSLEPDGRGELETLQNSEWLSLLALCDTQAAKIAKRFHQRKLATRENADAPHYSSQHQFQWRSVMSELQHGVTSAKFFVNLRHRGVSSPASSVASVVSPHARSCVGLRRADWLHCFFTSGCVPLSIASLQDEDRCRFEVRDLQLKQKAEIEGIQVTEVVMVEENQKRDDEGEWIPFARCPYQLPDGQQVNLEHLISEGETGRSGWRWARTDLLSAWEPEGWRYARFWPVRELDDTHPWQQEAFDGAVVRRRSLRRSKVLLDRERAVAALNAGHHRRCVALCAELGVDEGILQ